MTDPRDELPDVPALRTLVPPPGGLAALRERLDTPAAPRRWWLVAAPAALAIAALIVWLAVGRAGSPPTPLALAPAPTAPDPMPMRDPAVGGDVAFYWVSTGPSAPSAAPTARPVTISIDDAPRVAMISP